MCLQCRKVVFSIAAKIRIIIIFVVPVDYILILQIDEFKYYIFLSEMTR